MSIVSSQGPNEVVQGLSIAAAIDKLRATVQSSIQCSMPARVVSYNRTTHEATVEPLVTIPHISGNEIKYKKRTEIVLKVWRFAAGGFLIDFPISAGDTGWMIASDRDTSTAFEFNSKIDSSGNEGAQNPWSRLTHKFIYGFFIPDKWGDIALGQEEQDSIVIQNISDEPNKLSKIVIDKNGNVKISSGNKITVTTPSMEFNGKSKFTGDIEVDGNLQVGSNGNEKTFKVFGSGSTTSDMTVGGNNSVAGDSTVTGNSTISGTSTVEKTLSVNGDATLKSKLDVAGRTSIGGDVKDAFLYDNAKNYRIGDIVKYGENLFIATKYPVFSGIIPGSADDNGNWYRLDTDQFKGIARVYFYQASRTYSLGMAVCYQNQFFMCRSSANISGVAPDNGTNIYWMKVPLERFAQIQTGSGATLQWVDFMSIEGNDDILSVGGRATIGNGVTALNNVFIVGDTTSLGDAFIRKLLAMYPANNIYSVDSMGKNLKSRRVKSTSFEDSAFTN